MSFQDSLKHLLGDEKFRIVVEKISTQELDSNMLSNAVDGDEKNAFLINTGQVGHVRPINALEAQVLNYQLTRYPLLSHPTEFHGFIAYHNHLKKYRVYFGASDQPWPPHPDILLNQLDKDLAVGWKLVYHLHNHYEPVTNDYLGILAPSLADAEYFRMLSEKYDLENALITNGIHTVVIDSGDFDQFDSH